MSKDQLKTYLENLDLEIGFKESIFKVIDSTPEINQTLLSTIAELLELQADYYEKSADLLEKEAREYEVLQSSQRTLLDDLNKKIGEVKSQQTTTQVDTTRQELAHMTQSQPASQSVPSDVSPTQPTSAPESAIPQTPVSTPDMPASPTGEPTTSQEMPPQLDPNSHSTVPPPPPAPPVAAQ